MARGPADPACDSGEHPDDLHPGAPPGALSQCRRQDLPHARRPSLRLRGRAREDRADPGQDRDPDRGQAPPRKGQLVTLKALQMLALEVRRKIEYWVVGGCNKGHYEDYLRSQAAKDPA